MPTLGRITLAPPSTPRRTLLEERGWRAAEGPAVRVRTDGGSARLEPLAERDGRVAFLHAPRDAAHLPTYADRRRIVRALSRRVPGALVVFALPLSPECIWSWIDPRSVGPDQLRERPALDGTAAAGVAPDDWAGGASAAIGPEPASAAAAECAIVAAFAEGLRRRRVRWSLPDRPGRGGSGAGAGWLRAAQQFVEASNDPAVVRAAWRALGEMRVVDPECADGDRLLASLDVLGVLADACLERTRVWTDELAHSRAPHRPEKLADLRRMAAAADGPLPDARLHGSPALRLLRCTLVGTDPDAASIRRCREKLRAAHLGGEGPVLVLRPGSAAAGFASAADLHRAAHALDPSGGLVRDLRLETDTLVRARRLLLREAEQRPGTPDPADEGEFGRRLDALRGRLDALAARAHGVSAGDEQGLRHWIAIHRPVHLWLELAAAAPDGVDVVLGPPGIRADAGGDGPAPACGRAPAVRDRALPFPVSVPLPHSAPAPFPAAAERVERGDEHFPDALVQRLGDAAPNTLFLRGASGLLRQEPLAVFCSVRVPGRLVLRSLDAAHEMRDAAMPLISGFHSPLEREFLDLVLQGRQPVIVAPARCVDPFRLPSAWQKAAEQGRMLLVSRFGPRQRRPTARLAVERNRLVGALAGRALVAHATPGGTLHHLARWLITVGVPVFTWADPANADLIRLGAQPVDSIAETFAEQGG